MQPITTARDYTAALAAEAELRDLLGEAKGLQGRLISAMGRHQLSGAIEDAIAHATDDLVPALRTALSEQAEAIAEYDGRSVEEWGAISAGIAADYRRAVSSDERERAA